MTTTAWLGLGFVLLLTLIGGAAVWWVLRNISRSELDQDAKSRWGLLIGLSPSAGLFAWSQRDKLLGHAGIDDDDDADGPADDEITPPR